MEDLQRLYPIGIQTFSTMREGSTLHSYFSGRKDLFQGLAIEKLEKDWVEYPVLHFDMSAAKAGISIVSAAP